MKANEIETPDVICAKKIIRSLRDRGGFDDLFGNFDEGITNEIINEIASHIKENSHKDEYKVLCADCGKPIKASDFYRGLFMKIKEGGVIHWNCDDQ